MKEGVIWGIGDGSLVNIWEDPWVVGEEGRFITSPKIDAITKVSDIIDPLRMVGILT